MAGIFLSYRRDDSGGHAGRLADDFKREFSGDQVWRDIEAIEAGADFVDAIGKAVSSCSVLLALIGPRWLEAKNPAGNRRLDDPRDFVRIEIATALERGVLVIPVLVGDAEMPAEAALPEPLRPLARRQAHELSDKRWDYDVGQLFATLEKLPGLSRRRAPPPQSTATQAAQAAQGTKPHAMPGWARGMIGVIAAVAVLAIIGNMMNDPEPQPSLDDQASGVVEQMRPTSTPPAAMPPAPPSDSAASSVSAPPPAKPSQQPASANVAGTWMSADGDGLYIEQQGTQLVIVAADAAQQHGFMGQGVLQGRQVQMVLMHLNSGLNMEIRATLSEDGRHMQGTARMPATGATDTFVLDRQ